MSNLVRIIFAVLLIGALVGCNSTGDNGEDQSSSYCARGVVIYASPDYTMSIFIIHDLSGLKPIPYDDVWMQLSDHEFVKREDLLCK